jgi:gliding motility-associated-like protein
MSTGTYTLFADNTAQQILAQNNSGTFQLNNIGSDTAFYVKIKSGDCSSAMGQVIIKVVDKSFFSIASAFTPNGDGLNDRLSVNVSGYIKLKYFKIFNKYGETLFQTSTLQDSWNGFYKNTLQNLGSYVWIAEGLDINGSLVKDKGVFILLR